jgi:hypothetical protein
MAGDVDLQNRKASSVLLIAAGTVPASGVTDNKFSTGPVAGCPALEHGCSILLELWIDDTALRSPGALSGNNTSVHIASADD